MALIDTVQELNGFLSRLMKDLHKVHKGNKAAAQRVRVGTVAFAKIAKQFRQESVAAEKSGKFKKKGRRKKRRR